MYNLPIFFYNHVNLNQLIQRFMLMGLLMYKAKEINIPMCIVL